MNNKAWFDFDIRNDPIFDEVIKPFILNEMTDMERYDARRQAAKSGIRYIFHEHAKRVAADVLNVAARLGQPGHVQAAMYWAMLVHDLGKKTMPIEIWTLEQKPSAELKAARRTHAERGLKVVNEKLGDLDHPFITLMRDIMTNHHEHMDGTGHHGLKADQLSMPVRLCCIVESYDGYTISRPHFNGRDTSPAAVLEKMRSEPDKGAKMFDMELFEAFAKMKLENPLVQPTPDFALTP